MHSFRKLHHDNLKQFLFLVPNVGGMLMQDTVILKNEEKLIRHLLGFLNKITFALKLCYRASLHGWSSQQFHQQCDGKVNTVVLVKVGNYIFGGYTDQTWQGNKTIFNAFRFMYDLFYLQILKLI